MSTMNAHQANMHAAAMEEEARGYRDAVESVLGPGVSAADAGECLRELARRGAEAEALVEGLRAECEDLRRRVEDVVPVRRRHV